jgi:hypothetical protein
MASMKGANDLTLFYRMFHYHMTSSLPDDKPAIFLKQPHQFTGFHEVKVINILPGHNFISRARCWNSNLKIKRVILSKYNPFNFISAPPLDGSCSFSIFNHNEICIWQSELHHQPLCRSIGVPHQFFLTRSLHN